MKQKYIGASPLVDVLFIPFTGRFTSGYQDLIRSGFINPPCFYVDPSSTHFRIEGEVVLSSPPNRFASLEIMQIQPFGFYRS